MQSLAKAGTLAIIGVYPKSANAFPLGAAMNRNLSRFAWATAIIGRTKPKLVGLVASGKFDPTQVITKREPLTGAFDAYAAFSVRDPGWLKVELSPQAAATAR